MPISKSPLRTTYNVNGTFMLVIITWTPSSLLGLPPSTGVPGWDRSCCRRKSFKYSSDAPSLSIPIWTTQCWQYRIWYFSQLHHYSTTTDLGSSPWQFVRRRWWRRWWRCWVPTLGAHLVDRKVTKKHSPEHSGNFNFDQFHSHRQQAISSQPFRPRSWRFCEENKCKVETETLR